MSIKMSKSETLRRDEARREKFAQAFDSSPAIVEIESCDEDLDYDERCAVIDMRERRLNFLFD